MHTSLSITCHVHLVCAAAPLSTSLAEGLRPLLEPLGQLLYDILRPRFVQLADMEILAELIDILQHQLHRDQLLRRAGPGGEALLPALSRALADLQERLIYRQVNERTVAASFSACPGLTARIVRQLTLWHVCMLWILHTKGMLCDISWP